MFPNRAFLFPAEFDSPQELMLWILGYMAGVVAAACVFYATGTAIMAAVLGGIFVLAIVLCGGFPELLVSASVAFMLKVGGETAVSLIKPWGGEKALNDTMTVVTETGFPQLTVGVFIILFFVLTIPQHAIARWTK